MILDNELISNRPKELLDIEYYTKLPIVPTEFNYKTLPAYLNMDLLSFIGIMPKTIDLVNNTQFEFYTQPSEKEIKYYRDRNTRFQVVHVVANIHSFKHTSAERVSAYPYSISLIAGPKRGKPDECSIELLANADIEKITQQRQVYTDFSPFKPVQAGLFAYTGLVVGNNIEHYTDTIGFVLETFFLPTDIDLDDVPMSGPQNIDPLINEKYRKYRIKRYFKPFEDIKPRKIWGCDSPIELFLIQALAQRNIFPVIQTLIFKDGKTFDNFFEMIKSNVFIKGDDLITEVDLYFPDKKLAVFCDSTQFHRGSKNKSKDELVSAKLLEIGIKTVRISGKEIIENLNKAVDLIVSHL